MPFMNKKIIISISAVLLVVVGIIWFVNQRRSDISDELQATLSGENAGMLADSDYSVQIKDFYDSREFMEIWLFNGTLSNKGEELLDQIEDSKYDGLQPADYNLEQIYALSS